MLGANVLGLSFKAAKIVVYPIFIHIGIDTRLNVRNLSFHVFNSNFHVHFIAILNACELQYMSYKIMRGANLHDERGIKKLSCLTGSMA